MLRISRSCLVNMNYVSEVNRTLRGDFILVLAGGATVTSSEGFRAKVKDYLAHAAHHCRRGGRCYSSSSGANGASNRKEALHPAWFPDRYARSSPGVAFAARPHDVPVPSSDSL